MALCGTTTTCMRAGNSTASLANMPGRSSPSALSKRALHLDHAGLLIHQRFNGGDGAVEGGDRISVGGHADRLTDLEIRRALSARR